MADEDIENDAPDEIPNEVSAEVRNMTPSFKVVDTRKYFELIKYKPHGRQWLFHESKARFKLPIAGRRFGKTQMVGKDVQPLLLVPNKRIWAVGSTYDLGEKEFRVIWDDMIIKLGFGREPQVKRAYSKKQGNMFIEFPWNTRIEVRSADKGENLVGEKLDYVIMSEAAKHNKETWERFIRPALSDNRGGASFGTCVTGDTLMVTEDGIIEIDSLYNGEAPGTYLPCEKLVAGFAGPMEKATKFFVNGYGSTIKVATGLGNTLEGTPNHPVWTMRNGVAQWVELQDLKIGDWTATRVGANVWGNNDDTSDFVKTFDNGNILDFDTVLTPKFMYLLGYLIGNGHIDFKNNRVSISTAEKEIGKFIYQFGFRHYHAKDNEYGWQLSRKILVQYLKYLGFTHVKGPNKVIPSRLLKCSPVLIRCLLSGLFDADGTAHITRNSVRFTSSSQRLVSQIQFLLINFGIVGRVTESINKPTKKVNVWSKKWELDITGQFAKKFHEDIGFKLPRKRRNLSTNGYINRFYGIPTCSVRFQRLFNKYKTGKGYKGPNLTDNLDYLRQAEFISYEKVEEFISKIEHVAWDNDDWQYLKQLCNERYYWSQVKKLETSSNETYDLVIPTTHSFISNTMISHNTPEGMNWIHQLWQYGQNPEYVDFASWRYPSWENPYVYPQGRNDPEIQLLERTMPREWFLQEIAAEFTSFMGRIYSEFDEKIHVRKQEYNPLWKSFGAWDWGFVNPLAFIEFQVDPMDRVHVWREHYLDRVRLEDHIEIIKNRKNPDGYKLDLCFGDAADPEAVATVCAKFAPCVAMPESKENWREGVELVKGFLKTQQVSEADEYGTPLEEPWLFVDHSCVNIIREFNNYRVAPRTVGRAERNPREDSQKFDDHCFVSDTMVLTNKGEVPIQDIKIGDSIVTRFGYKKVTNTSKQAQRPIWRLLTQGGSELYATQDHPILTDLGWVRLDALSYGDMVFSWSNLDAWNLRTIKLRKNHKTSENMLLEFDHWQRHGIQLIQDALSTENLAEALGKIEKWLPESVNGAEIRTRLHSIVQKEIGFAPTNVRALSGVLQALTTKTEFVPGAEKSFRSIATLNNYLVADYVVKVTEEHSTADVYDLTLANAHEFVANRILVSNSLDALRYGLMHIFKLGANMRLSSIVSADELVKDIPDHGFFTSNISF